MNESHFELRFGNQSFRCRRPRGSDRFNPRFTRKHIKNIQGRGGLEFLKAGEMMVGER
jgi:hypothetical protein